MPGSAGLFTPLNMVFKDRARWIRVNAEVQKALADFCLLLGTATAEPTHVNKLVPGVRAYVGYCNTCWMGASGVWLLGMKHIAPVV